jgi:phosphomethylpyrimidine synthase
MKISQEVREFARLQNTDEMLANQSSPSSLGEGDHSPLPANGGGVMSPEEAEAGMAEMSKVYDATGRELYMGAGDRERD